MLASADLSLERDSKALSAGEMTAPDGLSVILCCHNSASRLPATLGHLTGQRSGGRFPWEVILVDNASSDATGRLAQELWPQDAPAPLRVVHEARLGLAYARRLAWRRSYSTKICIIGTGEKWIPYLACRQAGHDAHRRTGH
ncbi:MAG: hypothetical protein DMG32_27740 [Acidobacteria bacterium]|nr:MAG: hypothetical protein DMG32_27740 [Acidobacteriota bacterium]